MSVNPVNKKLTLSEAVNWSALAIILISFILLILTFSYLVFNDGKPVRKEYKVILQNREKDTVKLKKYLEQIDEATESLNKSNNLISEKIYEINGFYKLLGTILAIVLAIVGFFGFKSIQELRIRNIEISKEVAGKEAKERVEEELRRLKELTDLRIREAGDDAKLNIMAEHYRQATKIEAIDGDFKGMQERVNNLEQLEAKYDDLIIRMNGIDQKITTSSIDLSEEPRDEGELLTNSDKFIEDEDVFEDK